MSTEITNLPSPPPFSLTILGDKVEVEKLPERSRKKLDRLLKKAFAESVGQQKAVEGLACSFDQDGLTIRSHSHEERIVPLEQLLQARNGTWEARLFKKILKIYTRWIQEQQRLPLERTEAEKLFKKTMYMVSIFSDALSSARNSTSFAAFFTSAATAAAIKTAVAFASIANGLMWTMTGVRIFAEELESLERAYANGDWEGMLTALGGLAEGGGLAVLGGAFVMENFASHAARGGAAAHHTAVVAGQVVDIMSFVLYGTVAAKSIYELGMGFSFRSAFEKVRKKGSYKETLQWLRDQALLSKEEKQEIRAKAKTTKDGDLAVRKAGEKKRAAFERRTSARAYQLIKMLVTDEVIEKADTDSDVQLFAHNLIASVSKESFKQRAKASLLLLIAIVGLLACYFLGPTSPALFAVGAILWLALDHKGFHEWYAEGLLKLFGGAGFASSDSTFRGQLFPRKFLHQEDQMERFRRDTENAGNVSALEAVLRTQQKWREEATVLGGER